MGWVALAGAVLSAAAQKSSANAQVVQMNLEKRQEAAAATDREVQRARRLNAILGAQNAEIAASGVVNQGSIANVSLTDARRAAEDSQVDRINTSTRITAINTNSRAIRRTSNVQAAATIFSAAGRSYERNGNPFAQVGKPTPSQATEAGSGLSSSAARYA